MVLLVLTVVVLIASVQGVCVEGIIINDRQFLRFNICALYFRYTCNRRVVCHYKLEGWTLLINAWCVYYIV